MLQNVIRRNVCEGAPFATLRTWGADDNMADYDSVERTIRPIALNRKKALFAGHDTGAENWATIASLIETCKLNAVDPLAYLSATLTAIMNGHKQSRIVSCSLGISLWASILLAP